MIKTKVLCTIGPASDNSGTIRKMLKAGMDAVRINTSHGTLEEYRKTIKRIRKISNVPILLDTQGPQIRLVSRKEVKLAKGESVSVGFSQDKELFFSKDFLKEARPGMHVLLNDGLKEMVISKKDKSKKELTLKALMSLTLKGNMHSNIPSVYIDLPILSKHDIEMIEIVREMDADFIDLSFTRRRADVLEARRLLRGSGVGIITKIENSEGVKNVSEILREADGVMVARGDLGIEIPSEKVPLVQKQIVKKCNQAGKIAIVATQMLASMVSNPRPTRAETSDVANAILDGADCVMLSNETAVGAFPVKATREMKKIALQTEPFIKEHVSESMLTGVPHIISESIFAMSKRLPVKKILAITKSGFTARMISRFKPSQEIIAVTDNKGIERKLKLSYGVIPFYLKEIPEKKKIARVALACLKKGLIQKNDLVIFTAGIYQGKEPTSNTIQIHRASNLLQYAR